MEGRPTIGVQRENIHRRNASIDGGNQSQLCGECNVVTKLVLTPTHVIQLGTNGKRNITTGAGVLLTRDRCTVGVRLAGHSYKDEWHQVWMKTHSARTRTRATSTTRLRHRHPMSTLRERQPGAEKGQLVRLILMSESYIDT